MATTIERKYALLRIKAGDYLLPANTGETLWRIMRYEDGPSFGIEEWPRDKTFWGIWRWTGDDPFSADPDDWDRWDGFDLGYYETRQEAIDAALKL